MPSQPALPWLELEQVGVVTVAKFTVRDILDDEVVRRVGDQLYSLVEKEGCRQLVINFAKVRMLNSTMLAKLVTLRKKMNAVGGRLALCETNPELDEVFEILKLPQLFSIFNEEDKALESFQEPTG